MISGNIVIFTWFAYRESCHNKKCSFYRVEILSKSFHFTDNIAYHLLQMVKASKILSKMYRNMTMLNSWNKCGPFTYMHKYLQFWAKEGIYIKSYTNLVFVTVVHFHCMECQLLSIVSISQSNCKLCIWESHNILWSILSPECRNVIVSDMEYSQIHTLLSWR